MHRLLKMSWFNVKNELYSKVLLLGIIAAFAYSMLWVFLVHPPKYGLEGYDFEFGRFLFVIMLYAAVSTLRNDIRSNTIKTVFTGVFSRTEIMLSKAIALFIWGIIFFIIVEVNNVIVSCILYEKIGVSGFLAFNHLQLFVSYIAVILAMGSLMILIMSIIFNEKKSILFFILIITMVNFYTAGIYCLVNRQPEMAHYFTAYMKTPFYNTTVLQQEFNMQSVIINLLWTVMFFSSSFFIINKREIK